MKKLLLSILTFIIIVPTINASDTLKEVEEKVTLSFSNGEKNINEVDARKYNEFSIYLNYNAEEDFDINLILGELNYDKNKLELIDIEGLNNFTSTYDKLVLFDRYRAPKEDNNQIAKIIFKAKKTGKSKVTFKTQAIANFEEQTTTEDISVNINTKANVIRILLIIGIILVPIIAIVIIYLKVIKKKINKTKR